MKKLIILFALPLLIILVFGFGSAPPPDNTFKVARVVDGDMIRLTNGERARNIGLDTLWHMVYN